MPSCSYIVFARYRGVTAPIGRRPGRSGRGNTFRFVDRKLSGEVGNINYFVVIVYTDYTKSEPSSVTTQDRDRNMSKSLWSKLMKINARSGAESSRRSISTSDKRKDNP